jgi:tRNA1(Val) A37 N6-methylase TrmN6
MSSINPHFTFEYSQPQEYRFSHDSVFMARRVFEILECANLNDWRILDLCAGCGIVGLDFLYHLRAAGSALPASIDFLDVQPVYAEHFARNSQAIPEASTRFLNKNYADLLESTEHYDLILCNPPFFRENQGHLSPSEFKNRCRFFIDSDFKTLLQSILHTMKPNTGRAYLLLRDLSDHGIDVEQETRELLEGKCKIQKAGDIRGTSLISLSFV